MDKKGKRLLYFCHCDRSVQVKLHCEARRRRQHARISTSGILLRSGKRLPISQKQFWDKMYPVEPPVTAPSLSETLE